MISFFAHAPLLPALVSVFPFDPAIEKPMAHQHLVFAYCFCWGIQLAYLGYVMVKSRAARRAERQ